MNLQELFPEVKINHQETMGQDWISFPLGQDFLHFPSASLSEREVALLALQRQSVEEVEAVQDAWYQYFIQQKGKLPYTFSALQMIYLEYPNRLTSDLVELFQGLLPNLVKVMELNQNRAVLFLNQEEDVQVDDVLQDILPTVENDFGTKLTIFFGNTWSKLENDEFRQLFDNENQLFTNFVRYKGSEQTISFAQMILWAKSRQLDMGLIPGKLQAYIDKSKDITEIIPAMWESQGNLVQTAQKLFMHRNSLQYKLDKFQKLSGLNLKNLDDLAFCHLLLLTN